MRLVRHVALAVLLSSAVLTGCMRSSLDRQDVEAFLDRADDLRRKRFAPQVCALYGERFTQQQTFMPAPEAAQPPSDTLLDRKTWCATLGRIAKLNQYVLERDSVDIVIAPDARTAQVEVRYVEKLPWYFDEWPASLDSYEYVQVLDHVDRSTIGIESGEIVYFSTDAAIEQTLVKRAKLPLPYD